MTKTASRFLGDHALSAFQIDKTISRALAKAELGPETIADFNEREKLRLDPSSDGYVFLTENQTQHDTSRAIWTAWESNSRNRDSIACFT